MWISVFFGFLFFKEEKTINSKKTKKTENPTVNIASLAAPMDYWGITSNYLFEDYRILLVHGFGAVLCQGRVDELDYKL